MAQPRQYFEVLNRVGVASERHRKGADVGTAQRILRQQRRLRVGLFQPLDDGQRLSDSDVIILQRRHQPLRVDREVGWLALLALAQMMRQVLRTEPLDI